LATKLTRVIQDKKKSEALPLGRLNIDVVMSVTCVCSYISGVKQTIRDNSTEEKLAEYRSKIAELQEQNILLKSRLALSRQEAQAGQQIRRSNTSYEGVPSKIDTVS
jgi:hypothetical protein